MLGLSFFLKNALVVCYKAPSTHVDASPIVAESFSDLPPAYIQVAGGDLLRDEGLLYEQKLREHGVPTKLEM